MSAGEEHITIKLVNVDDICVLVGVKFRLELICFFYWCIFILE